MYQWMRARKDGLLPAHNWQSARGRTKGRLYRFALCSSSGLTEKKRNAPASKRAPEHIPKQVRLMLQAQGVNWACGRAGTAIDALVSVNFCIVVDGQSIDRAGIGAGTTSDASILINLYSHDVPPHLHCTCNALSCLRYLKQEKLYPPLEDCAITSLRAECER